MLRVWVLVLVFSVAQGQPRLDPLVSTKQGLIRGLNANDGDYSMFLGIPYAKVDKDNPFGHSTPHPKFDQIFEATDDSVVCPQIEGNTVIGDLDCLNLNVFVPHSASSANRLPVMVWIHGGSLAIGSGTRRTYGPKYLVQHDIVLVTVNYRLGPYGFLCLDTPAVPGNQGVKDQTLAMRWVRDNIASFGGDASRITIGGESAGGSSVEYHLYSNQELLYDKVIIQSGSAFTAWAISEADPSAPSKMAAHLGFEAENHTDALNYLKNADPKQVMTAYAALRLVFRVCVEKVFDGVESFLTEHQLNSDVPKVRDVPVLTGYASVEQGALFANVQPDDFEGLDVFGDSLRIGFDYDEDFQDMENLVRRFYIGDEDIGVHVRSSLTDFRSDIDINYPMTKSFAKLLASGARDVFHYVFSYDGGRNYNKLAWNVSVAGAIHVDDIGYLFDRDGSVAGEEDQRIIDCMTTMWTNFVKYGDPTPETTELLPVKWNPITKDTYHYLDIDKELKMKRRPYHDRVTFWELFYTANMEKLKGYRRK